MVPLSTAYSTTELYGCAEVTQRTCWRFLSVIRSRIRGCETCTVGSLSKSRRWSRLHQFYIITQIPHPLCFARSVKACRHIGGINTHGNWFIERGFFKLRDFVNRGYVDPRWWSGKDNPEDVYTKAVSKETWDHLYRWFNDSTRMPGPPSSIIFINYWFLYTVW